MAADEAARKLAADHAAIREAYAREQAAAAPPAPPAAPLVQGVDDEWADWRGCVCGGSYYGEMVACEGECDNWFHFACVGLTRLPRGEWLCQDCKTKPKKRRVEKQPEPLPSPPKKKKENRAHSKEERKDREELEAMEADPYGLQFQALLQAESHAERLDLFRYLIDVERKRLAARQTLQSMFSASSDE